MAKLISIVQFSGTLSNITFRQTADGNIASVKSGLTRKRIMTDPAFERSRYAIDSFGKASSYAARLRKAIVPVLVNHTDNRLISRLTAVFMKLLMQDATNPGDRRLDPVLLRQLIGFECN